MKKGFTLIELLIVISIIAILSAIGLVIFISVQPGARDARRRADIDAIGKVLEVNKQTGGYQPLQNSQFANGSVPTVGPISYQYCINTAAGATQPAPWATNSCTNLGVNWSQVAVGAPLGDPAQFLVCTSLESGGGSVFCRGNAQ